MGRRLVFYCFSPAEWMNSESNLFENGEDLRSQHSIPTPYVKINIFQELSSIKDLSKILIPVSWDHYLGIDLLFWRFTQHLWLNFLTRPLIMQFFHKFNMTSSLKVNETEAWGVISCVSLGFSSMPCTEK